MMADTRQETNGRTLRAGHQGVDTKKEHKMTIMTQMTRVSDAGQPGQRAW